MADGNVQQDWHNARRSDTPAVVPGPNWEFAEGQPDLVVEAFELHLVLLRVTGAKVR